MFNLKYDIKLNSADRPYIHLPDDYDNNPEDKFLALEFTRYIFRNILETKRGIYDNTTIANVEIVLNNVEIISDEIANILKEQMISMGDMEILLNRRYHVKVSNIGERDDLNYNGIVYNGRIYKRNIGLKVLNEDDMCVYELVDGIDNVNWKKI